MGAIPSAVCYPARMTPPEPMTGTPLPAGFTLRAPRSEDAPAIADLLRARDIANYGAPDSDEADVRSEWTVPLMDPARDAWIVFDPGERPAGYALIRVRDPGRAFDGELSVSPQHSYEDVGRHLLERLEARARERAEAPDARLNVVCPSVEAGKVALVTGAGFEYGRTFFRMAIDVPAGFRSPDPPADVAVRPLRLERDERAAHAVLEESFSEHFGFARRPFDEWWNLHTGHERFDPDLCFLAWRGEEALGGLLAFDFGDMGFVREVGVLKPWRGRGIATALLLRSFQAFLDRGQARVMLGVDSENPGALGLYERLGMNVDQRHDLYRKVVG